MKKNKDKKEDPNLKGISQVVMEDATHLGEMIASNERAMRLLHDDNEQLRKRLEDIFVSYRLPYIEVEIPIDKKNTEKYHISMVSIRGFIPINSGMKKMLCIKLKAIFKKWEVDKRKRVAENLASFIEPFLRKDSILVTKTRECEWGKKLEEDKVCSPYLYLTKVTE